MSDSDAWQIPPGWKLKPYPNDTFSLIRLDGVTLHSYKTRMMIWGWRLVAGEEPFLNKWDDGVVAEAAAEYPDPALFLPELDSHHPIQ